MQSMAATTASKVLHVAFTFSYWGALSKEILDSDTQQVAGSETAMLHAVYGAPRALRKLGLRDATSTLVGLVQESDDGITSCRPMRDLPRILAYEGPFDVIVCWTDAERLVPFVESGIVDRSRTKIIVANQCTAFAGDFAKSDAITDSYVFPSRWHAEFMTRHSSIAPERIDVVPNGVPATFGVDGIRRDPFRVYHASSPDRGLHHLLRAWPLVAAAEPRAKLDVFYELRNYLNIAMSPRSGIAVRLRGDEVMRAVDALEGFPGVTMRGGKGQGAVRRVAAASGVMAYPCDPIFPTETFGSAVLEAYAFGCEVVLSDADCFKSLWGGTLDLMPVRETRDPRRVADRILRAMEAAQRPRQPRRYKTWNDVALEWTDVLTRRVAS